MSYRSLLRHRVTVSRTELTGDTDTTDWGQEPVASVAVASDVPALVQVRTSRERRETPQGETIAQAVVYLLAGTDVTDGDRIIHEGTTWEVEAVVDAGGQGRHLELQCVAVTP